MITADTTTADTTKEAVHEFARAVRSALDDLPADEVDELTDGLEADLAERAIELGGTEGFGDPVAYADELRVSAGLPERIATLKRRRVPSLSALLSTGREDAARRIRQVPAGAWLLDLLVALRPVWWLIRGWVAYELVAIVFGQTSGFFPTTRGGLGDWLVSTALFVALELISIQWGRGRWLPWTWLRGIRTIASVIAVVAVLPLVPIALNAQAAQQSQADAEGYTAPQGLSNHGQEVDNIFAFDASGKPLSNVRLYDQDGHPLQTKADQDPSDLGLQVWTGDDADHHYTLVPSKLADGTAGWSVFPLRKENGDAAPAPFDRVQPLAAAPEDGSTPVPTPSPTLSVPAR